MDSLDSLLLLCYSNIVKVHMFNVSTNRNFCVHFSRRVQSPVTPPLNSGLNRDENGTMKNTTVIYYLTHKFQCLPN